MQWNVLKSNGNHGVCILIILYLVLKKLYKTKRNQCRRERTLLYNEGKKEAECTTLAPFVGFQIQLKF